MSSLASPTDMVHLATSTILEAALALAVRVKAEIASQPAAESIQQLRHLMRIIQQANQVLAPPKQPVKTGRGPGRPPKPCQIPNLDPATGKLCAFSSPPEESIAHDISDSSASEPSPPSDTYDPSDPCDLLDPLDRSSNLGEISDSLTVSSPSTTSLTPKPVLQQPTPSTASSSENQKSAINNSAARSRNKSASHTLKNNSAELSQYPPSPADLPPDHHLIATPWHLLLAAEFADPSFEARQR